VKIHVISDATGETAERVVRAAVVQFEGAAVTVVRRRNVRTPEQVRAAVAEADAQTSIVVHSLVSDKLRRLMLEECRLRGVDSLDMLGPLLDRLALHLKLSPQEKPGLLEQLTEARSREIEAVEFAFRHDDGQNAEELDRAEIVLVGVSRSMKTPTMLYLAYRGWFVANVPLIPGIELPRGLAAFPGARVICLQTTPDRLVELRRVRAKMEAIPLDPYASPETVREEIRHARQECSKHGWRSVDVAGKSVEEVGREIIALVGDRGPRDDGMTG
jgi:[pyruvate, water dikinase]-phosphate phosphotransferase / [pyruvate, water dikinase] kinase